MDPDNTNTAATMRQLEDHIAILDGAVKSLMQQVVVLSQAVLDRAKRDEVRMAMFEANRVVQSLTRGAQFHPKSRTVVFVGRATFSDNVKYAYLAFCQVAKEQGIRGLFLPHDQTQFDMLKAANLPVIHPQVASWSVQDARAMLSAAVVVFCDNFHPHSTSSPVHYGLLQGAKSVQLWHGIPLKEIGLRHIFAPGGKNVLLSDLLGSSGYFDVLVGPSSQSEIEWRRWFAFHDFASIGNPRNDVFYRDPTEHDLLNTDGPTLAAMQDARRARRAVIVYAPTFRDHIGPDWFEKSGIIPVAAKCREQGHEFIINLHPFEQGATEELRHRYPALKFIAPGTDIYPLMKHCDVFITDYSSLAFDMLHVGCPQIFFRPDHADYMARARELVPGREGYTPGMTTYDPAGLETAIGEALEALKHPEKDAYRQARLELRDRLFDHHDGRTGERLNRAIGALVESAIRDQRAKGIR